MSTIARILTLVLLAAFPVVTLAAGEKLTVKATNKLDLARPAETITLTKDALAKGLKADDLKKVHVQDEAGKEVLCQAVDVDGDHNADEVIFQADFKPGETKTFTATLGDKQVYTRDQFKAFGRFVRERFDDYAWENDRIAHRIYGKALETWSGEPLTSSAVDIWCKRTRKMVVNDWYMMDNYHKDIGEGADLYSAGPSRGCGGNGVWKDGKLNLSKNFVDTKTLTCGPIRVMFDLTYEPFDAGGVQVTETKRITLDAGRNLDHLQSFYKTDKPELLTMGIGIKNSPSSTVQVNKDLGWLCTWEPLKEKGAGNVGMAIVVDPKLFVENTKDASNYLVIAKVAPDRPGEYYAGFGWDKSGDFADYKAWETYVNQFAQKLQSPIEVVCSGQ